MTLSTETPQGERAARATAAARATRAAGDGRAPHGLWGPLTPAALHHVQRGAGNAAAMRLAAGHTPAPGSQARTSAQRATAPAAVQRAKAPADAAVQRAPATVGYEPGEKAASLRSPGHVERVPDGILLYGFPVNKQFIKPEHRAALRAMVGDFGLADPATVTPLKLVVGFSDDVRRTGGNVALREDRADAVSSMLGAFGAVPEVLGRDVGAPSGQFLADNTSRAGRERNRAVLLTFDARFPEPPDRPTPPPTPAATKKWTIRTALSAATPKPGIGVSGTLFVLKDVARGERKLLLFAAVGLGVSAGLPVSFGLSDTEFETPTRVGFKDFDGPGAISQVDAGPGSAVCRLFLPADTIPKPVDASGVNLQLSVGASEMVGEFTVEP
ncbi:hypothetical protein Lfu02_44450 [Longispora fulva]|uniref:Outer membrane protein OmpA-like peptidoglycan-associated protein n=1 Tax=Longispora fulva TaxID=619741 RepID=A0A8J7KQ08_9ACTN|nr:hypothetical protein [Longispora fulva]MBG6136902.1 outer membrane protein OmpA-like peptidoglycan-associated protein [Longispora fulva]GIG60073.1 hypothetical protein Lfu02_44450 [Longispora fulva]